MSGHLTVEQQFLVGPGETRISELEKVVEVIAGKFEDPGSLHPVSKRVAMVVAYLELVDDDSADDEEIESCEMLRSFILFRPGDPGVQYPIHERVIAIFAELEKTIAKQRMTLEAIGRAEGV